MRHDTIEVNGVRYISYEAYEALLDEMAFDQATGELQDGEETIPHSMVVQLGEAAHEGAVVDIWRQHRGMSQRALAEAIAMPSSQLNLILRGKKNFTVSKLKAVAEALQLEVEDILC